jgi:hypothetical protein
MEWGSLAGKRSYYLYCNHDWDMLTSYPTGVGGPQCLTLLRTHLEILCTTKLNLFFFFTVAFEKFGRVRFETQVNSVSRGRGLSQGTVPDSSWVG